MANSVVCLCSGEAHEFGKHGSGGDFNKDDMVEANIVEPVLDLEWGQT